MKLEVSAEVRAAAASDGNARPRVDERRRVISGIMHGLKSGGRWVDAPSVYGPRNTLYNRFVRWEAKGVWVDISHALAWAGGAPAQVLMDSSAVKAHRCGANGVAQPGDRPLAWRANHQDPRPDRGPLPSHLLLLTGGEVADCTAGDLLFEQMPASPILPTDKGYDTSAIRHTVEGKGAKPNIPPKANRR